MDNPALAIALMFLFCTAAPSALAFAVGRYGFPRLVWPRRNRNREMAPALHDEEL